MLDCSALLTMNLRTVFAADFIIGSRARADCFFFLGDRKRSFLAKERDRRPFHNEFLSL